MTNEATRRRAAVEAIVRARLAKAWDEGWDARDLHGPVEGVVNPYAPTAQGSDR